MQGAREIDQSFASLRIGAPVHLNFALFPLFDDSEKSSEYLLLDDALDRKLAHVTEVSADGRVPELAFENDSSEKILLVDGDELVGAKQNRILNLSILVGSRQKLVIPVSYVEQRRWRYHSREPLRAQVTVCEGAGEEDAAGDGIAAPESGPAVEPVRGLGGRSGQGGVLPGGLRHTGDGRRL